MGKIIEIFIFVIVLVVLFKLLKGLATIALIVGVIYFIARFLKQNNFQKKG